MDHSQLSTLLYQVDNFIQNKNLRKDNYSQFNGYSQFNKKQNTISPFETSQSKNNTKYLGKFDPKTENKNAGRELRSSIIKEDRISYNNISFANHSYSKY
jgi:hypothetical protein